MNIFIFLSLILIVTLFLGRLIEKIRIPWVFAALFLGLLISIYNPFTDIISSDTFSFLGDLGMYFLLFIIGLELDLKSAVKQGKFMAGLSFLLVLAESICGSLLIHYIFGLSWPISILTASSFATVGEAILIPILDEYKATKTKFGQILLGIGTIDDIIELITIIAAAILFGTSLGHSHFSLVTNFIFLGLLFLVPLSLQVFQSKVMHFKFKDVPPLFLFGLAVLFIFIGLGYFVESAALGAIFAGLALKNLLSSDKVARFESVVRTIAYGFFVPIFFFQVGSSIDLKYLLTAPLLILLVLAITSSTKILISYLTARKKIGGRAAMLLGVGLSAKFSTSIVILSMLYQLEFINLELYSILIGAMIVSQFIIPVVFSLSLKKYSLSLK